MNRQPSEWQKIFATDKGLISKIIQTVHAAQYQRSNPIKERVEDLNRHFSKEDIQMASKHIKRCSMLLLIREMQIKTTITSHQSEWPSSKNLQTINAGDSVEKREPLALLEGM